MRIFASAAALVGCTLGISVAAAAPLGVAELGISRGTTFHVADPEQNAFVWKPGAYTLSYLPAGTLLEVYPQASTGSSRRTLVKTEYGEIGFVVAQEGIISGEKSLRQIEAAAQNQKDLYIVIKTENPAQGISFTRGEGPYRGQLEGEKINLEVCRDEHASKYEHFVSVTQETPKCFSYAIAKSSARRINMEILSEAFSEGWIRKTRLMQGLFPVVVSRTPFDADKECFEKVERKFSSEQVRRFISDLSAKLSGIGLIFKWDVTSKTYNEIAHTWEGQFSVVSNVDFLLNADTKRLEETIFAYTDEACKTIESSHKFYIEGVNQSIFARELTGQENNEPLIFHDRIAYERWYEQTTSTIARVAPQLLPAEVHWIVSQLGTISYSRTFMGS